jgi:two-component system cell cycle sensor histidine kinase/response regulator CckA
MPDMSGPALVEQLRSRWPDVKLIYMSGYAQDDKLQPELQELEGSFLPKPFSTENLILKVREVLDSKPERTP